MKKSDKAEYHGFQDLPTEIAEKLKKRIVAGEEWDTVSAPRYTQKELERIIDAFTLFNNAVKKGLPNQIYQMMVKSLDAEIAQKTYAASAIWYAHEGDELAKEAVQNFADKLKAEINKRVNWNNKQFHKEYFLSKE